MKDRFIKRLFPFQMQKSSAKLTVLALGKIVVFNEGLVGFLVLIGCAWF